MIKDSSKETIDIARKRIEVMLNIKGTIPVDVFHRKLGVIMTDCCGISRNVSTLQFGLREIKDLEQQFYLNPALPQD